MGCTGGDDDNVSGRSSERLLRTKSTNGSHECARVCSAGKLTGYFKRLRAVLANEPVTAREVDLRLDRVS